MQLPGIASWNIYNKKGKLKIIILFMALLIGGASIYYTQRLVNKLAQREEKMVDLYAKALKNAVQSPGNQNLKFIFNEIIEANKSIPVILTDEEGQVQTFKNIDLPEGISEEKKEQILRKKVEEMKNEKQPIKIELFSGYHQYIYYQNSYLLVQLQYYPFVQLTIITIFAVIVYVAFSYSKSAEQNRVWVGLAKETAHQLGTPISSLMAWVELLKANPKFHGENIIPELENDISRLEMITERFSNIGSAPDLKSEEIVELVTTSVNYLRSRLSTKVEMVVNTEVEPGTTARINKPLFSWVIENLCKNAVDAMAGKGKITLTICRSGKRIILDITDTGKGIPKSLQKEVFRPGFTTKKRGWGLGLTLVKRIIDNYHKGKIYVVKSEVDKGTTFRILLNR